jgi:hypothetical protein
VRETKLRIQRGDDASFTVNAVKADGKTPQDITGATLWFTAKNRRTDADGSAVFQKTGGAIVILDGPGGIARVDLAATDTSSLTQPTTLYWDFQSKVAGKVQTLAFGRLYVRLDVTRAT